MLLAAVGLGASAVAAWLVYERENHAAWEQFDADVRDHVRALEREIDLNLEVLLSLGSLYRGATDIDREEFERFARAALERHPAIQALEWVAHVPGPERERYEQAVRDARHPGFRITKIDAGGRVIPAGNRAEYFPVDFIVPLEGNENALGLDLASDAARRDALERARERGTMQATSPIVLVQEPEDAYGFLVLLPILHGDPPAELVGLIAGAYRVPSIFASALRGIGTCLTLTLIDETGRVIYRHAGHAPAPEGSPVERRQSVAVAGRVWTVAVSAGPEYLASRRSWATLLSFVVGLLLTGLAVSYVRISSTRTRAVRKLVEERTGDLTRLNERLERQRNILQSILDNLGDGVAVADEQGKLVLFNPAAERILGRGLTRTGPDEWSSVYGLFRPDMITPVPAGDLPLTRAVAGQASRDVDLFVRNPERPGGVFIRVTATPLEGDPGGGVAVFRDVSERKWAEAVLRDSEARFRAIVEATASALVILSADHRIRDVNPQAERIFGLGRSDALGQSFLDLCVPAEQREAAAREISRALDGEATSGLELTIARPGAPERTLIWSLSRLVASEDREAVVVATGHDITERRQAEAAARVRELAKRLQSAREVERAHLAREIHDELGQALTGLKYEVSYVSRKIAADSPTMRERLENVGSMIDRTIVSLRRIAADLRPLILDELGLFAAIRWLVKEFEERTRIPCGVELPESQPEWTRDQATALFRILQEALTNVARHSGASRADVRVWREDGRVVLEVRDDGRGITADQAGAWESFGLLGMQERAATFGGSLEVRPATPRGTCVRVSMPY